MAARRSRQRWPNRPDGGCEKPDLLRHARRYVGSGLAIALILVLRAVPVAAADGLDVTVEDGLLSAQLGSVPVADVLAAVAEQTGAKLSVRGELGNARPQAFSDVPLKEALPRLVQPNGVILQFDPGIRGEQRLVAIHAVAPGSPGQTTKPAAVRYDIRPGTQPKLWDYEDSEKMPSPQQRIEVLQKLAKQRQPPLQALTFVLGGDPDTSVRRAALGLIANIRGEEAHRIVIQSVADPDPELRIDALRALASGGEKPVNLLAQAIKNDIETSVRVAAITMLGRRDGELARAILESARNDPDPQIRDAVEQALQR